MYIIPNLIPAAFLVLSLQFLRIFQLHQQRVESLQLSYKINKRKLN